MQRAHRHRRGALDIVVEREQLVAVALEDRLRVRGREILPLQQHIRQLVAHGGYELVDESVVVVVVDAPVPPAEVLRVLEEFDVVGAHVEHDRQGARRADPTDQDVERQLADRDAHPADALIPQSENPLAVGHHDHVGVAVRAVAQHLAQMLAVGIADEQSPRAAVDLAELLAGLTDRRRVDDRHRLGDVVAQQPVEQRLVAVLQGAQVDVLIETGTTCGELAPTVLDLLIEGLLRGGQQTKQPVLETFGVGEGGALGGQRVKQLGLSGYCLRHLCPSAGRVTGAW